MWAPALLRITMDFSQEPSRKRSDMNATNTQGLPLASDVRKLATALQAAAKAVHVEAFALAHPHTAEPEKVWKARHEECTEEGEKWLAQNPLEGFLPAAVDALQRLEPPIGRG